MEIVKIANQKCHDCQKKIKVEGKEIKNGVLIL